VSAVLGDASESCCLWRLLFPCLLWYRSLLQLSYFRIPFSPATFHLVLPDIETAVPSVAAPITIQIPTF